MYSVQQDLLDNDAKPGDFPSVLYANEVHDAENPFHNFLKNDNLVKVSSSFFIQFFLLKFIIGI